MAIRDMTTAGAARAGPLTELERLRVTSRRQADVIQTLRDAVSTLSSGARALKSENEELRAEAARLRGDRRSPRGGRDRVEGTEVAEVTIPIGTDAPAAARAVVARCLARTVEEQVLESAQLIVSELVTNSLLHSGAGEGDAVLVRVHLWRGTCRLEVQDPGGDGVVAPRPPRPQDGSGMGLHIVQTLSTRWGVVRASGGPTRVWAQLACGTAPA